MDQQIHSFIHCRACAERGQIQRLEAGVSTTGVVVKCKKHGLVCHFSPQELTQQLAQPPQCDCCPGGIHSN